MENNEIAANGMISENTENTEYETDSGSAGQSSSDGTKTDGAGEENQNTDENEQAGADE